jgi:hypothetical protein
MDRQEWLGIYARGQKVGYASMEISGDGEGFLVEERAMIRLNLLGIPREVRTEARLRTDSTFTLRSFRTSLESGPTRFEMDGEVRPDALVVEIRSAGRSRTHEISLQEPPWLAQNLRYFLFQRPLHVGARFQVPLFDPLTLVSQPLEIIVEAREGETRDGKDFPVYRLLYSWNGLQSRAWVSEAGETLREEGFGGFSLVQESREVALTKGWPVGKGMDFMQASAVPVETQLAAPRELSYLKIRFSRADLSGFALRGGRQRSLGQEVEVFRENVAQARSYPIPHESTPELTEALSATPLIQSDDPQVREVSARILGGERDALVAVERTMRWVNTALEKVPTVSIPSAVEILRTRQGDCNEHAVLFAALSRAAGIPTRICAGLLYQEGKFFYHAWNEVYLGKWFSVDALLGQFPTDASHIKFVEGELDRQARLVPLIGKLKAEILAHR